MNPYSLYFLSLSQDIDWALGTMPDSSTAKLCLSF